MLLQLIASQTWYCNVTSTDGTKSITVVWSILEVNFQRNSTCSEHIFNKLLLKYLKCTIASNKIPFWSGVFKPPPPPSAGGGKPFRHSSTCGLLYHIPRVRHLLYDFLLLLYFNLKTLSTERWSGSQDFIWLFIVRLNKLCFTYMKHVTN